MLILLEFKEKKYKSGENLSKHQKIKVTHEQRQLLSEESSTSREEVC